jgi:hypothetical protein
MGGRVVGSFSVALQIIRMRWANFIDAKMPSLPSALPRQPAMIEGRKYTVAASSIRGPPARCN